MEIFQSEQMLDIGGTVVALGNFDGLHIAHQRIVQSAVGYAKKHGLKSGVLLFDQHASEVTHQKRVALITSNEEKIGMLSQMGVDFVYMKQFDKAFMKKTPEQFVQMLGQKLNVRAVCVGYDYTFGYRAEGTVAELQRLGKVYGFEVIVTDQIVLDGTIVGSTYIRTLLLEGDVVRAARFLGRRYTLSGEVEKGLQNGRKMGIQTANLAYDTSAVLPREGVYAATTEVKGIAYPSVVNVGANPTFSADKVTVESHILDFRGELYGTHLTITFLQRLRGDEKFPSVDALKAQIGRDIEAARKIILEST
jgi:riboflavin kinase/FMN adenylyltransferase